MSIWKFIKSFFLGEPLKDQFQRIIEEEEKATAPVTPQITDAVTTAPVLELTTPAPLTVAEVEEAIAEIKAEEAAPVAPKKPKRAKTTKGRFKADDKATPDVNEAWEGGKAPAKKPRKKNTPNK